MKPPRLVLIICVLGQGCGQSPLPAVPALEEVPEVFEEVGATESLSGRVVLVDRYGLDPSQGSEWHPIPASVLTAFKRGGGEVLAFERWSQCSRRYGLECGDSLGATVLVLRRLAYSRDTTLIFDYAAEPAEQRASIMGIYRFKEDAEGNWTLSGRDELTRAPTPLFEMMAQMSVVESFEWE